MFDNNRKLLTFSDPNLIADYVNTLGWILVNEIPTLHDLDVAQSWISQPDRLKIDCVAFLAIWNLFEDVSFSVFGARFLPKDKHAQNLYQKLFWGNNLLAVTPVGKHYYPSWTSDEVKQLQQGLQAGLRMFTSQLAL